MTIVAHGSAIDKSEAKALLERMESVLVNTLKEGGENVILDPFTNSATSEIPQAQQSNESMNPKPLAEPNDKVKYPSFQWTEESQRIRAELASLANVEDASIHEHSSIFELGLDSIDVIKLSSRLKKQGLMISVSTIIKCQSIAEMASNTRVNDVGATERSISSDKRVNRLSRELSEYLGHLGKLPDDAEIVLPATPLQQTMVNEMLKSNFGRYFNMEAFILDKDTDRAKLLAAIQNVLAGSPILRTQFIEVDDPKSPVSYAQVVLKGHAQVTESDEPSLESFLAISQAKTDKFASSNGALFQVDVITTREANYMIWTVSHALYDGTSLRLLHQDIGQAYSGNFAARPDYMPFLEQVFKSTTEEAKNFWRNTLSNLPQTVFPKKDAAQVLDTTMVYRSEAPSHVPLTNVEKLCKSSKVTLQTVGQTCWAILLAHLMGQLDVVFGSVLSCRDSEEANEIMFPLMNTVAVRAIMHGRLIDMLKYMQDMSDATRPYQHFPLGTAQALALASRGGEVSADTTIFDTLFIYQGRRLAPQPKPLYDSVYGVANVEIPVCVEMEIIDDRLSWTAACKSMARNAIETENIIEMLDAILKHITDTPDAPTLVSDADDISICGLPKFRTPRTSTKTHPKPPLQSNGEEWTSTELIIRKALHLVSGVSENLIHKDSTIFHLGLDSIVILKIPALLRGHGITLSVADILKGQTISSMTRSALRQDTDPRMVVDIDEVLLNSKSSLDSSTIEGLESIGNIQSVMPATAGQLYMIRMWQASRGVLFYPSFTYSMHGSPDRARLEQAWVSLVQHHDILRTGFIESESGIQQIIFKGRISQGVHPTESQQMGLQKTSVDDLRRPPVALLVEESGGLALRLKLIIHHALYDGISLPVLMEQFQRLYHGDGLPPAMSFKTFVGESIATQIRIPSQVLSSGKSSRDQWTFYLDQSSHHLQTIRDTSRGGGDTRTEVFHPTKQVSPLGQQAQDIGVSVDAILLASISRVYLQFLGKNDPPCLTSDIVFGIYLANRAPFGEDLSALAAPTLNILPLRVRNPLGRETRDMAVEIQEDLRKISSSEMSSASLKNIYDWTGVRVNFVVNILKSAPYETQSSDGGVIEPVQDITRKAGVVKYSPDGNMPPVDERCDAYLVSLTSYTLPHMIYSC